jgi:hypothetical protein
MHDVICSGADARQVKRKPGCSLCAALGFLTIPKRLQQPENREPLTASRELNRYAMLQTSSRLNKRQ